MSPQIKKNIQKFQKKLNSLVPKDYNFFSPRIYFTSNCGSQNTFAYLPTLDTLSLKEDKSTDYVLSWKSKGNYNVKLKSIKQSIKLFGYKIGIKFDKGHLAVEQNNYTTKLVNLYIVYDLDAWQRNPTGNFKFTHCFWAKLVQYKILTKRNMCLAATG